LNQGNDSSEFDLTFLMKYIFLQHSGLLHDAT
jgi:hypothetical protein